MKSANEINNSPCHTTPRSQSLKRKLLFPLLILFFCAIPSSLSATTTVTLTATTSPTSGQAGITNINITGSGFPAGTISPTNVTITLQQSASGGSRVTTTTSSVTTVLGSVRRVMFRIPASILVSRPTNYIVSIAGTDSTGTAFSSGNVSTLVVNPPPQIVSVSPAQAAAGQTLFVRLTGQYTSFVQGVTQANFGPAISVGGGVAGAFGPVTVLTATTLIAQISVDWAAVQGARTVTIATGAQQAVLAKGFQVEALISLAVTPANPSIPARASQQFTAIGTYSDGSIQNLTSVANWSSSARDVATISSTGLATAIAPGQATITTTFGAINGSTTLTVSPGNTFTFTGAMSTPRLLHTATLLNNGMVLVAGGLNDSGALTSAELYNPATATFTPTGSMNIARNAHTATLLNNGMVLIAGGSGDNSAELYNPATGKFSFTSKKMIAARNRHTATVLNDGTVLITGGWTGTAAIATAEVYDPAIGTFTTTGSLKSARLVHSATLLNDGKVLIAGGETFITGDFLASAELYDPAAKTFTYTTSNMNSARASLTATLLNDGTVLMTGGFDAGPTAELYNPSTQTFTPTLSTGTSLQQHTATLLTNGFVLVTGGFTHVAEAELYDAANMSFASTGSMNTSRALHTATLLNNGSVLIAGGDEGFNLNVLSSAELYEPSTRTPPNLISIAITPATFTMSISATQQFAAIGKFSDGSTERLAAVSWSSLNTALVEITNDVSNHAVAVGRAPGTVSISARAGSVIGFATLTVR